MMSLLSIIKLTFRETLAKKTFIAFFTLSSIIALIFLFAINLDVVDGAQAYITVFGQDTSKSVQIDKFVRNSEGFIAMLLFTGGIFMSLFATSSLIPSFLEKGTIDLIISKPISRTLILLGRFLGALIIVGVNVIYLIGTTWLIISIKTGIWNVGFLMAGVLIFFTFAVLYSLMMVLGLLTKSSAFSLMITYFILFFSPLLLQRDKIYALVSSKFYAWFFDALYYFLPKTTELGNMTRQFTSDGLISSWTPLWSSALFMMGMLVLGATIFKTKNF